MSPTPYSRLCQGNARYISGNSLHRDHVTTREMLVSGQHPYAGIITCSDSRIVPEYIFDAGLGDLFVVRNAGNVVDVNVLASIEYAVTKLGVGLVVVMGHEGCGAVNAACSEEAHDGNLSILLGELAESVRRGGGDPERVVVENVRMSMGRLRGSDHLRDRLGDGRLDVLGAVYSLNSGVVNWI